MRAIRPVRPTAALLAAPLLVAACGGKDDEEPPKSVWQQFNSDDDVVTVEVGPPTSDGAPVDLYSNTGAVVIGTVLVDPASGPVGTAHDIVVDLEDDYKKDVELVQVLADSGARGAWTLDLAQDRARKDVWSLEVQSYGDADEQRTDTFTFVLWERIPTPPDEPE